jgi:hypothetical protein
MKIFLLCLLVGLLPFRSFAQDDATQKYILKGGAEFNTIPIIDPSVADSIGSSLSIAPYFKLQLHSGIGLKAQAYFLSSGPHPGYFMTVVSPFYSIDNKKIALDISYSHFFISSNKSIEYTPITNEIYASYTAKKSVLSPTGGIDLGFGTDTTTKTNTTATDVNIFLGVTHSFDWELNDSSISINFSPKLLFNIGTDAYFEFLKSTGFITHNKNFQKVVKNKVHGNGSRRNGTTTSSTSLTLNNMEVNGDLTIDIGNNFTVEPEASLFIPIGSTSEGLFGYWQLGLSYQFK